MKRVPHDGWLCLTLVLGVQIPASAQQLTVTGRVAMVDRSAPGGAGANSNVVVWLTPGSDLGGRLEGTAAQPSQQRFRVVQHHKRFSPHVLVLPVGSVVDFPNQDPFFHNVFSLYDGKRFDLGLYEAGTTRTVRFDRPGICYIFCNIHPEMSAVVVVVKTPYYAISDRAGDFTISNVPPGSFLVEAWCERALPEVLKSLTREITVTEGSHSLGTILLTVGNELRLAHKNKYGRDYESPTPSSPLYEQP